jgi:hypothetical protein
LELIDRPVREYVGFRDRRVSSMVGKYAGGETIASSRFFDLFDWTFVGLKKQLSVSEHWHDANSGHRLRENASFSITSCMMEF